jgi:SAM-dependent methyltransferase
MARFLKTEIVFEVIMDERLKTNLAKWNALVPVHARSKMYDVAGFKAGRISLHELELAEVGEVRGKSLLHLQCHFGHDTMSWARLGAEVTGLDFSDEAIKLARSLSDELKIPARFICADIYDTPAALGDQFDVVFTSYGAITWLPDMRRWAQIISHSLKWVLLYCGPASLREHLQQRGRCVRAGNPISIFPSGHDPFPERPRLCGPVLQERARQRRMDSYDQ